MKLFDVGEHLVKITKVSVGVSEGKKTPFYLIRFENECGYIDQRIYKSLKSIHFIKKLFQSAGLNFDEKDDWDKQAFSLLEGQIVITIVEGNRNKNGKTIAFNEIYKFNSVVEKYPYYTEEVDYSLESDPNDIVFYIYYEDELCVYPTSKIFHKTYIEAEAYSFKRYCDYNNDIESRAYLNLFKTSFDENNKKANRLIRISARDFRYCNESEVKNLNIKFTEVAFYHYDFFNRTTFGHKIKFACEEAAQNFVFAYNDKIQGDIYGSSEWAEIYSAVNHSKYNDKNIDIEEDYDSKNYWGTE